MMTFDYAMVKSGVPECVYTERIVSHPPDQMYCDGTITDHEGVGGRMHCPTMARAAPTQLPKSLQVHYIQPLSFDPQGRHVARDQMPDRFPHVFSGPYNYTEWAWDKHWYRLRPPPRALPHPPAGTCQLVIDFVRLLNDAMDDLPCWDEFYRTGVVHRRGKDGACAPPSSNRSNTIRDFPENQGVVEL